MRLLFAAISLVIFVASATPAAAISNSTVGMICKAIQENKADNLDCAMITSTPGWAKLVFIKSSKQQLSFETQAWMGLASDGLMQARQFKATIEIRTKGEAEYSLCGRANNVTDERECIKRSDSDGKDPKPSAPGGVLAKSP